MKEIYGNAWDLFLREPPEFDHLFITTNGTVKKNGCAVMGRGIAHECNQRYKGASEILGDMIQTNGNIVNLIIPLNTIL